MTEYFAWKTHFPVLQPPLRTTWTLQHKATIYAAYMLETASAFHFFKHPHALKCTGGDSLRLSRWARARHMARGISRRTPPSGMLCRSPGPRRWLCLGCWRARTGSPLPAPPAPRTAPEHLTPEQNRILVGGTYVNGVTDGAHKHTHAHTCENVQNQQEQRRNGLVWVWLNVPRTFRSLAYHLCFLTAKSKSG